MIVTGKAVNRRSVLRAAGTALALPLLDAMVPALKAFDRTDAKPVQRFGVVYVPNGIVMKDWTPAAAGSSFELTPILKSLEPHRDRLLIVTGLNSKPRDHGAAGVHARASTRFLTDIPPKSTGGADLEAGISMDQRIANELGQHTRLASLELGLESTESAGSCDPGYSCAYTSTISWRNTTTPLPTENSPRVVFERLFGDTDSTNPAERLARVREQRSILDSLSEKVNKLERGLGSGDRSKLSQYLDAVRDVERRIQNSEQPNGQDLPVVEHPAGIPATFEEHAKLMYDLYVLAYQCDLTRVATFMVGREFSGRTYPQIGVPDSHHPITHHDGDPVKIANISKINTYHVELFSYFVNKLKSTPDGDGSLLDHSTIVYGAGMSEGSDHDPTNLPVLLLGGASGQLRGGRHLRFGKGTPLANLHITLLHKLGIDVDKVGDSTGALDLTA